MNKQVHVLTISILIMIIFMLSIANIILIVNDNATIPSEPVVYKYAFNSGDDTYILDDIEQSKEYVNQSLFSHQYYVLYPDKIAHPLMGDLEHHKFCVFKYDFCLNTYIKCEQVIHQYEALVIKYEELLAQED